MQLRRAGLLIHLLTVSGAGLGLLALFAALEARFAACFFWLGGAFVVDAIDGPLARRFDVRTNAPRFDGVVLDLVVDYLTYVIVPLVVLWRGDVLPASFAAPVCAFVAALSALYFGDRQMKTDDNWFRGFPAVWNVVALYLMIFRPHPMLTLAIVAGAAALMFAPVVFVHPLRVARLRPVTLMMTALWGMAAIAATWSGLDQAPLLAKAALLGGALYFLFLSLVREGTWRP